MSTRSSNSPFRRLGRDVWLILGVALSVWVMLALASTTRTILHGSLPVSIIHLEHDGPLGALINEFMLIGFGYMAFALPVLIVWHALSVLREKALMDLSQTRGWIQFWLWLALAGFGLFTMAFCPRRAICLRGHSGGALGQYGGCGGAQHGFIGGGVALFALGRWPNVGVSIQWTQVLEALSVDTLAGLLGPKQTPGGHNCFVAGSDDSSVAVWQHQSRRALKAARVSKAKGQTDSAACLKQRTVIQPSQPDGLDDLNGIR